MRLRRTSPGWLLIGCLAIGGSACAAARASGGDDSSVSGSGGSTSVGGGGQGVSTSTTGDGGNSSSTAGDGGASSATTGNGGASSATTGNGGAAAATTGAASSSSSGGSFCTPNVAAPCYDGPAGTEDIGLCKGGTHVCNAAGTAFGACAGEIVPAVDDCQTPQDEDCDGTPAVCGGGVAWSRAYGDIDPSAPGVFHDHALGGMATDSAGNVYIAGNYYYTMDFGAAGQLGHTPGSTAEGFLAKIGPNGAPIWAKQLASTGGNAVAADAVAVDPQGNVTIVGHVGGSITVGGVTLNASSGAVDVFVASFTTGGAYRYGKVFTGPGLSYPIAAAAGANGDIAFTGLLGGAVTFGGNNLSPQGSSDVFVVKLDMMGNHVMSKRFGDSALQAGTGIAFTPAGNVVLGAYSAGTIDFGGGPLTATGASCSTAVAELDGATGAHVWSKLFDHDTTTDCTFRRVAVDPGGNILVGTSATAGMATQVDFGGGPRTGNFFLVKLSPAGGHVWSRGWSTPRGIWGLAADPGGNILITGLLSAPIDFGTGVITPFDAWDGFIAKLDPQGDGIWARGVSDSNQQSNVQWGYTMASDAAGNVFAGGRLSGATNFGDGELVGEKGFSSGNDVYLAKFAP